jgi:hypothetical protein
VRLRFGNKVSVLTTVLCLMAAASALPAYAASRLSKATAQRALKAYGKQMAINSDLPPLFSDGSGVTATDCTRLSPRAFRCTLGLQFDDQDATHCDILFRVAYATAAARRLSFRKLARSDCYALNINVGF